MKTYRNGMKATSFSQKQISVIFAKAKKGDLKVEAWFMKRMYSLAEFYGFDTNCSIEREEQGILQILEAVFAGDMEKAQSLLDRETASSFDSFTQKYQNMFDRSFVA